MLFNKAKIYIFHLTITKGVSSVSAEEFFPTNYLHTCYFRFKYFIDSRFFYIFFHLKKKIAQDTNLILSK